MDKELLYQQYLSTSQLDTPLSFEEFTSLESIMAPEDFQSFIGLKKKEDTNQVEQISTPTEKVNTPILNQEENLNVSVPLSNDLQLNQEQQQLIQPTQNNGVSSSELQLPLETTTTASDLVGANQDYLSASQEFNKFLEQNVQLPSNPNNARLNVLPLSYENQFKNVTQQQLQKPTSNIGNITIKKPKNIEVSTFDTSGFTSIPIPLDYKITNEEGDVVAEIQDDVKEAFVNDYNQTILRTDKGIIPLEVYLSLKDKEGNQRKPNSKDVWENINGFVVQQEEYSVPVDETIKTLQGYDYISSKDEYGKILSDQPIDVNLYKELEQRGLGKVEYHSDGIPKFKIEKDRVKELDNALLSDTNEAINFRNRLRNNRYRDEVYKGAEIERLGREEAERKWGKELVSQYGVLPDSAMQKIVDERSVERYIINQGYTEEQARQVVQQNNANNLKLINDNNNYILSEINKELKAEDAQEKNAWKTFATQYPREFKDFFDKYTNKFGDEAFDNGYLEKRLKDPFRRAEIKDQFINYLRELQAFSLKDLDNREKQAKVSIRFGAENRDKTSIEQGYNELNKVNEVKAILKNEALGINSLEDNTKTLFRQDYIKDVENAQLEAEANRGEFLGSTELQLKKISAIPFKIGGEFFKGVTSFITANSDWSKVVNEDIDYSTNVARLNRMSDALQQEVITYKDKSGNTFKYRDGNIYAVGKDGKEYYDATIDNNTFKSNLNEVSKEKEWNVTSVVATTAQVLAEIYVTNKVGLGTGSALSKPFGSYALKIANELGKENRWYNTLRGTYKALKAPNNASPIGMALYSFGGNVERNNQLGYDGVESFFKAGFDSGMLYFANRFFPDARFFREGDKVQKTAFELIKKGNKEEAFSVVKNFLTNASYYGKNITDDVLKENFEESVIEPFFQGITDVVASGISGDKKMWKDATNINNFIDTNPETLLITTATIGLAKGGQIINTKVKSDLSELNSLEARILQSSDPSILEALKYQVESGSITGLTATKAQREINAINTINKYKAQLPEDNTLSIKQAGEAIVNLQKLDKLKKEQNNAVSQSVKDDIQSQINGVESEIKRIFEESKNNTLVDEQPQTEPQQQQKQEGVQGQTTETNVQPEQTTIATEQGVSIDLKVNNNKNIEQNAIQEQTTNEGLLGAEQPSQETRKEISMGLPEMGGGNQVTQETTQQGETQKVDNTKQEQLNIINKTNPAPNSYNVWIRDIEDIKTWDEILQLDDDTVGQFAWGDYSREDAEKALENGEITVYSSTPIKDGAFVSTSKIQAEEYAGGRNKKVYSKKIPLNEVAWINGDEGQYAKVNLQNETEIQQNQPTAEVNQQVESTPNETTTTSVQNKTQKEVTYKGKVYKYSSDENGEFIISPKGKRMTEYTERELTKYDEKTKKYVTRKIRVANANFRNIKAKIFGDKTQNEINEKYKAREKEALSHLDDTNEKNIALLYFAQGGKVSYDSIKTELGEKVAKELTWAYLGKDGEDSIERVSERLAENSNNPNISQTEIRNKLIEVLGSHGSVKEIKETIVHAYNKSIDPNFGYTDEDIAQLEYQSLPDNVKAIVDSVNAEATLTEEEKLQYEIQEYEKQLQSLSNEEQDQIYNAIYGEQRTQPQNESVQDSITEPTQQEEITTAKEFEKLDLADKLKLNQALSALNNWENKVDKFGKETLGVNLPVAVAKGAIQAMKTAIKTAKLGADVLSAGINYVKETDWYKNQTKEVQDSITTDLIVNELVTATQDVQQELETTPSQDVREKSKNRINNLKEDYKKFKKEIDKEPNPKVRLAEKIYWRRQAVNEIKQILKYKSLRKGVTDGDLVRLLNYADKILSARDINKAFDDFQAVLDKALSRESKKERVNKEKYDKVYSEVENYFNEGLSLEDIIAKYEERNDQERAETAYYEIKGKQITPEQAMQMMEDINKREDEMLRPKTTIKEVIKKVTKGFNQKVVDRQYLPKKYLEKIGAMNTLNRLVNFGGAASVAKRAWDKAYNKIYLGLPENEVSTLNNVIQNLRVINVANAREKQGLPPIKSTVANITIDINGKKISQNQMQTKDTAQAYLEGLRQKIGDKKFKDYEKRANAYFGEFKGLLDKLLDAGMIRQEAYDAMYSIDYQPRIFLQHLLDYENKIPQQEKNFRSKNNGLTKDLIRLLENGSEGVLLSNSQLLLASAIASRTQSIMMNEINKVFIAKEYPEKKIKFEKIDPKNFKDEEEKRFYKYFKELDEKLVIPLTDTIEARNGYTKAYYFEDGVRKEFLMEDELHTLWNDKLKKVTPEFVAQITGANLFKSLATGYNPAFIIVNTPRDFLNVLAFSPEYSGFIKPFEAGKLIYDTGKAWVNIYRNNRGKENIVEKFVEYGGLMDWLNTQGMLTNTKGAKRVYEETARRLGKVLPESMPKLTYDGFTKVLYYASLKFASNYSELGFRVANFTRAINNQLEAYNKANKTNYKTIDQLIDAENKVEAKRGDEIAKNIYHYSVRSSRELLDFNQGGTLAKEAEAFIPYINAGIQGTRVAVRALKKDPANFVNSVIQLSVMSGSAMYGLGLMMMGIIRPEDDEDNIEKYLDFRNTISPTVDQNYFVIPTGYDAVDNKYTYIQIAKTQSLTPFFSLGQGIMDNFLRRQVGQEEIPFNKIMRNSWKAMSNNIDPTNLTTLFTTEGDSSTKVRETFGNLASRLPLAKAAFTAYAGHDFYFDQPLSADIGKVPSQLEGQTDKKIEKFYKDLALKTGFSAVRTKAFVESLITSPNTNPFVGLFYVGSDIITTDVTLQDGAKDFLGYNKEKQRFVFNEIPVINRAIRETSDFTRRLNSMNNTIDIKELDNLLLEEGELNINSTKIANEYKRQLREAKNDDEIAEIYKEAMNKAESFVKENYADDIFDQQKFLTKVSNKLQNYDVDGNVWDIKETAGTSKKAQAMLIYGYYGDKALTDGNIQNSLKEAGVWSDETILYYQDRVRIENEKKKSNFGKN